MSSEHFARFALDVRLLVEFDRLRVRRSPPASVSARSGALAVRLVLVLLPSASRRDRLTGLFSSAALPALFSAALFDTSPYRTRIR